MSARSHICRLWEIPQRLPLVDLVVNQQNRTPRWALLAIDKLNDLCDELDYDAHDLSMDVIEQVHYAATRAVDAANNL